MKKFISILLALLLVSTLSFEATSKPKARRHTTRIANNLTPLERKVVGKHLLSLQWISWDYYGECTITKDSEGRLRCMGRQESRENDNYMFLDGIITIVDASHLKFDGVIGICVDHIKGGEEYLREGIFDFVATGNRKYWRLQQQYNGECTDYVDIYFKKR